MQSFKVPWPVVADVKIRWSIGERSAGRLPTRARMLA